MVMNYRPDKGIPYVNGPARARGLAWLWTTAMLVLCISPALPTSGVRAAEMVRVKVKQANLRAGPGTQYKKVWKVPRNYPYRVLHRKGRWLKVRDFEGFEDWIYAPLTDRNPAVVVKVSRANVRKGPSTSHPVVFTADAGVVFRVIDKKGKWIKVRANDGDRGWIYKPLLWGFFGSGTGP